MGGAPAVSSPQPQSLSLSIVSIVADNRQGRALHPKMRTVWDGFFTFLVWVAPLWQVFEVL